MTSLNPKIPQTPDEWRALMPRLDLGDALALQGALAAGLCPTIVMIYVDDERLGYVVHVNGPCDGFTPYPFGPHERLVRGPRP